MAGTNKVETRWWLGGDSHRVVVLAMMDGMGSMTAVRCGWRDKVRGSISGLVW